MKLWLYLSLITTLFISCTSTSKNAEQSFKNGIWKGKIINGHHKEIPFLFEVVGEDEKSIYLINGKERLLLDDVQNKGDSLIIPLLVYDAEIVAKLKNNTLKGYYHNIDAYKLKFSAKKGNKKTKRFEVKTPPTQQLSPKYATSFFYDDKEPKFAIGLFDQEDEIVTGTFMSETGDYRFLEGVVDGDQLKLSSFDGAHIYRFEATLEEDVIKNGTFWSGKKWKQKWNGSKNEHAKLRDPNSLTSLNKGYDAIDFVLPNEKGQYISLSDQRYKGKVVILQILGTWCPNCMDESVFLASYYNKHKNKGIEIIGLAFENAENLELAMPKLERMKDKLGIHYELVYASERKAGATAKVLPAISEVITYPTTIFIDRNGIVRKIHTGFAGPSTGEYHEQFKEEFNLFMDKLIYERVI